VCTARCNGNRGRAIMNDLQAVPGRARLARPCQLDRNTLDLGRTRPQSGRAEHHQRHVIMLRSSLGERLSAVQDSPHGVRSR